MSSVTEQVLSRVVLALLNTTGADDRVYRSREEALVREESISICIAPDNEESSDFSDKVQESRCDFDVEIYARGDTWDQLADPVVVAVHQILLRDSALLALITRIRKVSRAWHSQEADLTAGVVVLKYRVKYLSPSDDLTTST